MSEIPLPDSSELAINRKNDNDFTICRHDAIVKSFWHCFVSLVKFSFWFKIHVNIITGLGVTTIFLYKGLTRNLEIRNTPIWVFPNIWRLAQFSHTKFGTHVSKKYYWMLRNARVIDFTVSELLRENQLGGESVVPVSTVINYPLIFYIFWQWTRS